VKGGKIVTSRSGGAWSQELHFDFILYKSFSFPM